MNVMALEREQPPYSLQRQLFGWVINHDPSQLYETLGSPGHDVVQGALVKYASRQSSSPLVVADMDRIAWRYASQAANSLRDSVRDVVYLARLSLQSTDPSLRDAVFMQTDEFVAGVANYAKLPTPELDTYSHVQRRSLEQGRFDLTQFLADSYDLTQLDEVEGIRGCPFSKIREAQGTRDPLFDNFVRWGARLTLRASTDLIDFSAS